MMLIFFLTTISVGIIVCAVVFLNRSNGWKNPKELLVEYMNHIPEKEYEKMYKLLDVEASGNISQEDFIKRNSAIYEGIEMQNMTVEIMEYDKEQMTVKYQTSFDSVAGNIAFENEAYFVKGEDSYK
ncbi:hypothetical protein CG709_14375, partial [Lachnotalea glycerini]